MLIVDTPFPPYTPVKVLSKDLFTFADNGDLDTATATEVYQTWGKDGPESRKEGYFWEKDGLNHRDGDLPAFATFPTDEQEFYCMGATHRIFGAAMISEVHKASAFYEKGDIRADFYLYSQSFSKEQFFKIHRLAIKYELPLWVVSLGVAHHVDFEADGLGEFTVNAFKDLGTNWSSLPITWLLRFWGTDTKYARDRFNKWYENIRTIVTYELSWYEAKTVES